MEEKKRLPLSQFLIRIIGMIAMTADHVGVFLMSYQGIDDPLALALRAIGRLAFPIFIFLLAEGMLHSHDKKKYLLRIGSLLLGMLLVEAFLMYVLQLVEFQGNPFLDLFLCGLVLYFLSFLEKEGKKKFFALFALFPIAYLGISYGVVLYEHINKGFVSVIWFPEFIRANYNIFGLFLAVGFYYANKIADLMANKNAELMGASIEEYKESYYYRKSINILLTIVLLVVVILFYGVSYLSTDPATGYRPYDTLNMSYQSYCLLIAPLLYFYNGKRGKDSKNIRLFNYLYFPMHLVLIFGVFALIFGL